MHQNFVKLQILQQAQILQSVSSLLFLDLLCLSKKGRCSQKSGIVDHSCVSLPLSYCTPGLKRWMNPLCLECCRIPCERKSLFVFTWTPWKRYCNCRSFRTRIKFVRHSLRTFICFNFRSARMVSCTLFMFIFFWILFDSVRSLRKPTNYCKFVRTKFSYARDLWPFVRMKFAYSRWPLRILRLA